jgi:hypothetical protein
MRTSLSSRFGSVAGVMALLVGSSCVEPPIERARYRGFIEGTYPLVSPDPHKQVDILFVIDNSSSMIEEQAVLAANFESFINVLERPEVVADYRIGVTTTDNGNPWCPDTTPEAGALRLSSCRSRLEEFVSDDDAQPLDARAEACTNLCPEAWTDIEILPTAIAGDDELRPRNWLESRGGRTNLPEGLTTVQALQCLGPQGIDGCEFESPLESMWRALRRSQTDDDPDYGFIRPHAILMVVLVTDEADCSYSDDWASIFLPEGNRVFWSDQEAEAPTSAVCWNAGVACEGTSPYGDCHAVDLDIDGNLVPEEDADELAVLHPVSRYIDLLQRLEGYKQTLDPEQEVLVGVIGGVKADGSVTYQDSPEDAAFMHDYGIGPGCQGTSGRAVPPVRLRAFAEAFELAGNRNMFSVCEPNYAPVLEALAEPLIDRFRPSCIPACVADRDPTTPDVLDPSCTVAQDTPNEDGVFEQTAVPRCEGNAVPKGHDVCHLAMVGDERADYCSDQGYNLEIQLVLREDAVAPPDGTRYQATCELSQFRNIDCPDLQ